MQDLSEISSGVSEVEPNFQNLDPSQLSVEQKRIYYELSIFSRPEEIFQFVSKARSVDIPESLISEKRNQQLSGYLYSKFLNTPSIDPENLAKIFEPFNLTEEDKHLIGQSWVASLAPYYDRAKQVVSLMELSHEEVKLSVRKWFEESYDNLIQYGEGKAGLPTMSQLSELGLNSDEIQAVVEDIVIHDFSEENIAKKLKRKAHVRNNYKYISHVARAKFFIDDTVKLPTFTFFSSDKINVAVDNGLLQTHSQAILERPHFPPSILYLVKDMPDGYKVTNAQLFERIKIEIGKKFSKDNLKRQSIDDVMEEIAAINKVVDTQDSLPVALTSMLHNFDIEISSLSSLSPAYKEYFDLLLSTPDQAASLVKADEQEIQRLGIELSEAELLKRNGINLQEIEEEDDYEKMFNVLTKSDQIWKDEQSIGNPFRSGAKIFGFKRMFSYLDRREIDPTTHQPTLKLSLSRHDALHSFESIIDLYQASDLTPDQFWGNIMNQVIADDRTYDEGNAHQHFNAIASTVNRNFAEVISRAQEYADISRLQELIAHFDTPQQVFTSWAKLKRYSELEEILEQAVILDDLKELKAKGKEKLYNYVETLAFHPFSKVEMASIIEFWRDPGAFIRRSASHTPDEVQDRKKPSNYVNMPNLDLDAEQLRDALVEGKMDLLQAFSPLEITYEVPVGPKNDGVTLRDQVRTALGSKRLGVEGAARSSGKLFDKLNTTLKKYGITVKTYLEGTDLPEEVEPHEIEQLIYNPDFGMQKPHVETQKYRAQITLKSSPEGVLAGNDTANCMPFGDGKTSVYTFNPNTAQFIIQKVREDDRARTIAQSVLTKDMDIGIPVPEVLQGLAEEKHLEQVLPESITQKAKAYIACDNIEVSPYYKLQNEEIIEAIYRDFFKEYLKQFGTSQGFVLDTVVIGKGYSDALTHLPEAPNTYAPQAPVSYSDKTHAEVYILDLKQEVSKIDFLSRHVSVAETEEKVKELPPLAKGISYLTYEDALRVAYIEGKAYSDNKSLIQYLHNMENVLIAKDINNAAKARPNMSLKYEDDTGKMTGYLLSYEGILDDEDVSDNDPENRYSDTPVLYLVDLASDKENLTTGGRLINGFIDLYRQNYLEQGNPIPLFIQAREQTSFRIIQRQLDKIGQRLNMEFDLVEFPTYLEDQDIMHPVLILPKNVTPT